MQVITQHTEGEIQRLTGQSKGLKVLSVFRVSSIAWWSHVCSKSAATVSTGRRLWLSAYWSVMLLGQAWASSFWGVQLIWSLQSGIFLIISSCSHGLSTADVADVSVVWGVPVTTEEHSNHVTRLFTSWHYCHGSHGIHFVKSKKSSIPYTLVQG